MVDRWGVPVLHIEARNSDNERKLRKEAAECPEFVVDGARFATAGWQNPTVTILSLSMRASEYLAEQMRTNSV